jgi:hypothetical protein
LRDRIGAAAFVWNLDRWWGLPSSSGHALVGGLVGAALVEGGMGPFTGRSRGWHPAGVFGVLIALVVAAPRCGVRSGFCTSQSVRSPSGDAAREWADPWRRVGDDLGALLQPRGQRRPEVDGSDRRAAAGHRPIADVRGAALGEARMRCGADARNGVGRLADRPYGGPPNLSAWHRWTRSPARAARPP